MLNARERFVGLPRTRLSIGDVRASVSAMQLTTLLGSCIAVCLYHSTCRVGGMNHISLPGDCPDKDARFGVHAMELLINQMMGMGCDRRGLVAKIFGGASILTCIKAPIGEINAAFVRQFLQDERIPVAAERLGGTAPMEVSLRTDTGYVLLRTLCHKSYHQMHLAEAKPTHKLPVSEPGDVVLF